MATLHPSSGEIPQCVLTITDKPMGAIPDAVFGQFLERPSWGGEFGPEAVCDAQGQLPESIRELIRKLNPPVVRFPGGTDIDWMDWTDLIDNAPGRSSPERPSSVGKNNDTVTNRFGLDEFFAFGEEMGFEKILVGNLRQALYKERPLDEAALHEAGLLAYANATAETALPDGMPPWGALRAQNGRAQPARVRYFMVGNESYFYWPPKELADRERLGVETDEAAWEWFRECLLAYGRALKAVDPEVELILDGFHDAHNPANQVPNEFRGRLFLDPEIRALYGHLAAHHYAPMGLSGFRLRGQSVTPEELSDEELWFGLTSGPGLYDAEGQNIAFGDVYAKLVDAGYRVAVTEWNFNAWNTRRVIHGRPFGIEVPAALATAGFLHGILRHSDSISLATQSMLLGTTWDITAIRAHPQGEHPPYWLPQGQVALFYRMLTGSELMQAHLEGSPTFAHPAQLTPWWPAVDSLPSIDAVVTRDGRGLFVHAINRSLNQELPLLIQLPASANSGSWKQSILHSDCKEPFPRSANSLAVTLEGTFEQGQLEVSLPKHSVSILQIRPIGP